MTPEPAPEAASRTRKVLYFILLAIGGGTIFKAMYLREVFYYPWNEFFGLNNTQSGLLMSWLGLVGIVSGAVAGIIVDRIPSPRGILSFAYLAMAALAFWQSLKPSYETMFLIVGLMSFVGNGLFLVSMAKMARLLAGRDQQGRFFGFLESGRGIAGTLLTAIAVAAVSANQSSLGIEFILRMDASVYLALGLATWFLLPAGFQHIADAPPKRVSDLIAMLRTWKLWVAALIVACTIFLYQGAAYLVPYLTDAYGMTESQAAIVGMIRAYFLAFLFSPIAGFLCDKVGSALTVMRALFVAAGTITASFIVVPKNATFLVLLIGLVLILGALTFGLRGIMYAQVEEIGIPKEYTGTAMGLIICIGFSPEAYIHLAFGSLLDSQGLDAYPTMFATTAAVLALGALACTVLLRAIRVPAHHRREVHESA